MTMLVCRGLVLLSALSLGSTLLGQSSSPYRITHTYTLGGDGGWDYIVPDPPQHRLFIGRQNRLMVVDENDGKLLGEVTASMAHTAPRSSLTPAVDLPRPGTTRPS